MTSATAGDRYRLAVEAGAEISNALAGRDAPATIARRVAQAPALAEFRGEERSPGPGGWANAKRSSILWASS